MAALEFGERIPMPIKQARENFRFDLALLQLVIALLIARVVLAIRIHRRHEHDVLPVRRPDPAIRAGRNVGHLMWLTGECACARIKIAHPDLRRFGRFRGPDETFAIGRKAWPFLMVWSRV